MLPRDQAYRNENNYHQDESNYLDFFLPEIKRSEIMNRFNKTAKMSCSQRILWTSKPSIMMRLDMQKM